MIFHFPLTLGFHVKLKWLTNIFIELQQLHSSSQGRKKASIILNYPFYYHFLYVIIWFLISNNLYCANNCCIFFSFHPRYQVSQVSKMKKASSFIFSVFLLYHHAFFCFCFVFKNTVLTLTHGCVFSLHIFGLFQCLSLYLLCT